jgi:hypothetical protein
MRGEQLVNLVHNHIRTEATAGSCELERPYLFRAI